MVVHLPYDSFRATFEAFAQAAARDHDVIAMKTTVYRTSDDSMLIASLIECAEEGKQSVCLVELKARFDERRNIEMSRAMEQAGVHVVHGFADLKIHAKMTLVVRREEGGLRRYVHIGTGNYNASTARLYEDVGLFTADEDIAADVADLFNDVTGFGRPRAIPQAAGRAVQDAGEILAEIRRVSAAADEGKRARIRLKLNQLVDPRIIEALYAASQAGVDPDLRSRYLHAPPGGAGAVGDGRGPFGRRPVPRAQPHLLVRGRRRDDGASSAAPTSCRATSTADRGARPVENARAAAGAGAVLDSTFRTTRTPGSSHRRLVDAGQTSRGTKPHTHQATMMRRALQRGRQPEGKGRSAGRLASSDSGRAGSA